MYVRGTPILGHAHKVFHLKGFVVLYCNFRSLAFLGLLGFLIRQLKIEFIATLLSAAKFRLNRSKVCNFADGC